MYQRGSGEHRLIVGVYVDHLVITGSGNDDIVLFKQEMKDVFQMSNLGLLVLISTSWPNGNWALDSRPDRGRPAQ